jgi:hypothetical protein
VLGLLYAQLDRARLAETLRHTDPLWLLLGVLLMAPPLALGAWRLRALVPAGTGLGLAEAGRLVLVAGSLNMVLPSKLGDVAKAWFLRQRGHLSGPAALALVTFEKGWDLLALLLLCGFGLLALGPAAGAPRGAALPVLALAGGGLLGVFSRGFARACFGALLRLAPARLHGRLEGLRAAWLEVLEGMRREPARLLRVVAASLLIWLLHLLQIQVFALALGGGLPWTANLALVPLAILAGLLPFTLAGVGTRDAALVLLLAPYWPAPTAAALGLLCTLRYLLPALAGLPLLGGEVARQAKVAAREGDWREEPPC